MVGTLAQQQVGVRLGATSWAPGGHVLAHLVDTRVSIRKGKGEQRVAKVLQHAFKGEAEATLQITPGGIDDAKD